MTTIIEQCRPTCPAGESCRAVKFGAVQYCRGRLADPEKWGPLVVRMAERDADRPAIPRPEGWSDARPEPEPPPDPGVPPPSWPPVHPYFVDARRIAACPHWTHGRLDPACGCHQNRCALGRGQAGIVDHHDCRACLAADRRREIVVARYREDLGWLADVPADYRRIAYSPTEVEVPEGVELRVIPGGFARESGAYLLHITEHWAELPHQTVFCQADPFDHSPDFLARLGPWYGRPTTLTTRYLEDKPADWIKALDRVEEVEGFEVRYGDGLADHQDATRPWERWFSPDAWKWLFEVEIPRPLWFGYGCCWAVPREFIRPRPLSFWRGLRSALEASDWQRGSSRTNPPVNPWTLEAMFLYIVSCPKTYRHRRHLEQGELQSGSRQGSRPA